MNKTKKMFQSQSPSNAMYQIRMSDYCNPHMLNTTSSQDMSLGLNVSLINNNSPYVNKICSKGGLFPMATLNNTSNQQDSGFLNENSYINHSMSPFNHPRTTLNNKNLLKVDPIQFQSTPNKPSMELEVKAQIKVEPRHNFHSIIDLAQSSSSINDTSTNNSQGYASFSTNTSVTNQSKVEPSIAYNDDFKKLANYHLADNKENNSGFIYKTKRRPRAQINKQQRDILEHAYSVKTYPDANEIEYLCKVLGFEENVIRVS